MNPNSSANGRKPLTDAAPRVRSQVWSGCVCTHISKDSPASLPFWPWSTLLLGRFPWQSLCTSCSFSLYHCYPRLPSRTDHKALPYPCSLTTSCKTRFPLRALCDSPAHYYFILLSYQLPLLDIMLRVSGLFIVCYSILEGTAPEVRDYIEKGVVHSQYSRNSSWVNKWRDIFFWRAVWK